MADQSILSLPLVELAKLGAAGISALGIAASAWLLHNREVTASRPVPRDTRLPRTPDTRPIYALMGLSFVSAILLAFSAIYTAVPVIQPPPTLDLSDAIARLQEVEKGLVIQIQNVETGNGHIRNHLQDPRNRMQSLVDSQNVLTTASSQLGTLRGSIGGVVDGLKRRSAGPGKI